MSAYNLTIMNIGDPNLRPVSILGEGGFGCVYLCLSTESGKTSYVCVKRIQVRQPDVEMKMLMDEIYIISQLKHPNIVRFIRSFVYEGSMNIVMEYASNGTVRDLINSHQGYHPCIPKKIFHSVAYDILLGLEYLHIRHVIHRDLKPENILLDERNRVKIADFGISKIHTSNTPLQGLAGTYFYMAPEVMSGEKFDFKSDIWSLGCILYEMCIGVNPFKYAKNLNHLKYLVGRAAHCVQNIGLISVHYGLEWSKVCERMLVVDPKKRVSIFSIVSSDPKITIPYYNMYFKYDY